jgi:SAM-dependent methyltransferase
MRDRRLLNFGCGGTFHPNWTNLDSSSISPHVIEHDLRKPFPFTDGTFDAVYGSHVLEHFEPAAARNLLLECRRILKPGGIVRLAVPDLEAIVRLYLSALEAAIEGKPESEIRYDWLMLELYDQVVRKTSGGGMAGFLANRRADGSWGLIEDRLAREAETSASDPRRKQPKGARWLRKLRSAAGSARRRAATVCAFLCLGSRGSSALREGLFRNSGEIHQWMYDRFSMARALERAGFLAIRTCRAGESGIEGFSSYALELVDGQDRKPDSLYIEGRKPSDIMGDR